MKSTKFRDPPEKPDLQFALGYPSESDKLRLRSGTVLQREVTERERRRLDRERKREQEIASKQRELPLLQKLWILMKQADIHRALCQE